MKKLSILVVALFAILGFTACGGSSNTPSAVANKYYKAMIANDYKTAVSLFSLDPEEGMTAEALTQKLESVNKMREQQGIKLLKVEVTGEEIDEEAGTAEVSVDAYYQKGDEEAEADSERIKLKLVDGKWMLSSL